MVMDMIDEAAMSGKRQSCRMIYEKTLRGILFGNRLHITVWCIEFEIAYLMF